MILVKERPSIASIELEGNKAIKSEALLEGLMRIQDKIRSHKITKKEGTGASSKFAHRGIKTPDELPLPHHSGFVVTPEEQCVPVFHHQKVKGK